MPLDLNLNTQFSPADVATIEVDLNSIETVINTAVPNLVNLSDDERKSTRTISNIRYPYAAQSIQEFGISYPQLNSIAIPLPKATNNIEFYHQLATLESRVVNLLDRVVDLKINAGYLAMKFADDMYGNAKNYRTENVDGADTVYDYMFPLYDREENPEPVAGGGNP